MDGRTDRLTGLSLILSFFPSFPCSSPQLLNSCYGYFLLRVESFTKTRLCCTIEEQKRAVMSHNLNHFNLINPQMMLAYFDPEVVKYGVLLPLGVGVLLGRGRNDGSFLVSLLFNRLCITIIFSFSFLFPSLSLSLSLSIESKRCLISDYYEHILPAILSRPYLRHRVLYVDTGYPSIMFFKKSFKG